ncbi:hypothetical protein [Oricola sp.]|uniref:hypothetical protein n=1 Tax=Oricola sp. TaxID=1979950 RepID=UPI003BA8CF57
MTAAGFRVFALALAAVASPAAGDDAPLAEPYKLMRSLQILQDKVAYGDTAAFSMQADLAKVVDAGFRGLDRTVLTDERNARALISYSMAGGNPATLEELIPIVGERGDELVRLAVAILVFQKGGVKTAAQRLQNAHPREVGGLFGASLALVRGLVTEDDDKAMFDFDTARLLAPGTLVEEAALRRLMTIHKRRQDPENFLRIASRYARRYIRSPYAMQFAHEFVTGAVAMDGRVDRAVMFEVLDFMPKPYRDAVVVRLMRSATVAGKVDLVRALTETVVDAEMPVATDELADDPVAEADPTGFRQKLYMRMSEVTSENVREVAEELRRVDTGELSAGDRELLNAVLAVADTVGSPDPVGAGNAEGKRTAMSAAAPEKPGSKSMFQNPGAKSDPLMEDFDDFVSNARDRLSDIENVLEDVE